jgi:transcriptional regulator with XRE-family HTH domain
MAPRKGASMPLYVSHNISIIRRLHGKTLEDVSARLGLSRSAYYRIEKGGSQPITDDFLGKFCDLFFVEKAVLEGDRLDVQIVKTL